MAFLTTFNIIFSVRHHNSNEGYTKRTVFVPIDGWKINQDTEIYDFKKNLNPISVFYRKIRYSPEKLECFKGIDFIFFGKNV